MNEPDYSDLPEEIFGKHETQEEKPQTQGCWTPQHGDKCDCPACGGYNDQEIKMNFEEYQTAAMQFAKYKSPEYPYWALIEEVGELIGKFAKHIRKHGGTIDEAVEKIRNGELPELAEAVKKELGDCYWQANAIMHENEWLLIDSVYAADYSPSTFLSNMALAASTGLDDDTPITEIERFCWEINSLVEALGFTIEEVLQHNIDKLSDRDSRGVIIGEGDQR